MARRDERELILELLRFHDRQAAQKIDDPASYLELRRDLLSYLGDTEAAQARAAGTTANTIHGLRRAERIDRIRRAAHAADLVTDRRGPALAADRWRGAGLETRDGGSMRLGQKVSSKARIRNAAPMRLHMPGSLLSCGCSK